MNSYKFTFTIILLCWVISANAQSRRPVQRSRTTTTQVKKTPSASKQEEQKQRELQHRLDSVEALYNDLKSRYDNDQEKTRMTKKDANGTEYQVARVELIDGCLQVFLRVRNENNSVSLNFNKSSVTTHIKGEAVLDNGDRKYVKGNDNEYVEKGYWREVELNKAYNINEYPDPKKVTKLLVKEGHFPDTPIIFENIQLTKYE